MITSGGYLLLHINIIIINIGLAFLCTRAMPCKLHCPEAELQLKYTLNGGQCFRWKESGKEEWIGVFDGRVWKIAKNKDYIIYNVYKKRPDRKRKDATEEQIDSSALSKDEQVENERSLVDYFRLNKSLKDLYTGWAEADPVFREAANKFYGIRIMKQDPVENIFSFICSSNNHISRISSMVEKLCMFYGEEIGKVDGVTYHGFPSVDALAQPGVEERLRANGFGYRAKYIHQSALKIVEFGGSDWLRQLEELPYADAKTELMKLTGVGAKVADCICLMSLGHLEAVPVDTHVFQIASRLYLPHLKSAKSVTPRIYEEIGDHFRSLYGREAGWAHTILFCADLKMFQEKDVCSTKKHENGNSKKIKRTKT